jgi:hypothetical protein
VIGAKRLIYAIDINDKTLALTRKTATDFFKNELGFEDNEIEFVDRNNFIRVESD